jgi:hypothetical protein
MNDIIFKHNFCESRLQENQAPELFNAYSSLFISFIPILTGFPKNDNFKNITYMFILNGFCSYYYHYSLSWFGKQLDEVTMIIANYYGIRGLLQFYGKNFENTINMYNISIMPLFIAFNTLPQFDYLFPNLFMIYVIFTTYLIKDISIKFNVAKTTNKYLIISAIGGISWAISENICNEYTTYGHVLWHYLFPFGLYKIVLIYDDLLDSTLSLK